MRLIDVGCAQGRDVFELISYGIKAEGIDNNLKYLVEGRKMYPNILLTAGNVESLPFRESSFDAILCKNVIFNVNPQRALPELQRILKPGGVGIVSLDEKIIKIDDNSILHSANLDDMLSLLAHSEILERRYGERVDEKPWQHKQYFIDVVFRKHTA